MELLLIDELRRELQRRRDVIRRHAVFIGDLLLSHPPGEVAKDAGDGNARTANHQSAVLHRGIDRNAVRHAENCSARPLQQPRQHQIRDLIGAIAKVVLLLRQDP